MIWTNAVGVTFTATLLSVGDGGATFVFPEDGATNTIPLSALSEHSAARACELVDYVPVSPKYAALFGFAERELDKLQNMRNDGRIGVDEAKRRLKGILNAFRKACARRGATEDECARLEQRLFSRGHRP